MAKEVTLMHVRTSEQIVDMFTNILDSVKLKKFVSEINLGEI